MSYKEYKKSCYCYTCMRKFHPLGIMRHRAMHRDKQEECEIRYTSGVAYTHYYDIDDEFVPTTNHNSSNYN